MTNPFTPPSIDPANRGNIAGTVRFILTKFLQGVDDMLPAIVISYDRATNQAQVQPLIAIVDTLGNIVPRGSVASIQVLQLGGGGFVLSFPIKAGDLGWIKANDRDISLFKKFLGNAAPNTARKHSFEDAMFIPDTMFKSVSIAGEDTENVVLQNLAGTVKIALFDDKVKITAPRIEMLAPEIVCTASTSITLDTPLTTITGDLAAGTGSGGTAAFHGPITTTSTIHADGEITSGSIPLTTHRHTGVQSGGSDTGGPVP